ncbi:WD repeat-containing protein 90 [Orycteropus afer afer]|uniref:WD repeat-containing protein 90 n=1 Tax=Orycteropus afer afer TaxID=1230840 RepID=A0AC54ZF98_ORYAF|nr:WD repeat-containing protein 90 [Orycteropus afer afer]
MARGSRAGWPGRGRVGGERSGWRGRSRAALEAAAGAQDLRIVGPQSSEPRPTSVSSRRPVWQQPFLNVFRHFKVDEWKRSSKEGDVASVMDKTLKSAVYRIRGSVSAGNYIQLPKTSTQSLGLTGRYLYVLFRPLPTKHFIIHLDVSTEDSQVVRMSFSNLFKEFKSTATWLQFPFIWEARLSRPDQAGAAPPGTRWTCLQLDLQAILLTYLNRCYRHLRSVRLCASLLVRNLYTSDLCFDPAVTVTEARRDKLAVTPMPREMAFPVPKGDRWHDHYVHIRFPSDSLEAPRELGWKSCSPPEAGLPGPGLQLHPRVVAGGRTLQDGISALVQTSSLTASRRAPLVPAPLPEVSLSCERLGALARVGAGDSIHVFACTPATAPAAQDDIGVREVRVSRQLWASLHWAQGADRQQQAGQTGGSEQEPPSPKSKDAACALPPALSPTPAPGSLVSCHMVGTHSGGGGDRLCPVGLSPGACRFQSFLPDPILRLKGAIGFGGHSSRWALWTKDGASVVYPCHAVVVVLHISTGEQRFFLGHTDKVSALALDGSNLLLASAQAQPPSLVWLWDFRTGGCLSMFQSPLHSVCSLSFSDSGAVLCGVGKDGHGRTMVVAWGTSQASLGGEVIILAKAHTDVDVQSWAVASDDTRMASCGRGSVRLWRLRAGALRSCPVDLGEHHALHFTDLAFERGQDGPHTLYVCSRSGHILEVDVQHVAVRHARRLLPMQPPSGSHTQKPTFTSGPGVAISSLSVSATMCAVGSEDCYLRLWPLDFRAVLLEAEHEGPVSSVRVSPDGLRVLSTTTTGHLGLLDVASHEYHVLARSHTASVLACAVEPGSRQLATVARDNTVCIWDLVTLRQLYDLRPSDQAPCAVAFHPTRHILFCGFCGGTVRAFSLVASDALMEHRRHRGAVTGLAVTPDGSFLFSACSQGTLAQYDCAAPRCSVLRVAGNMVCQDTGPSPSTLAVSRDSCLLAFVGPSKYTVTVVGTASLDELLRVDVSALDPAGRHRDSAVAVCFGPLPTGHLLVSTLSSKVLVLDAASGRTVQELSGVHPVACSSLALSEDARLLVTAGDRAIKVWDSPAQAYPGCQVFIGHSEPVQSVAFTPDQRQVLSVGDTVFLWDILAYPERTPWGRQVSALIPCPPATWHLLNPMSRFCSAQGSAKTPPAGEVGLGTGQQEEEAASGACGLPRRQVPMPLSQASPPQLAISPTPAEGSDGASSPRDTMAPTATRPDCYRHFVPRFKTSCLPQSAAFPPAGCERLRLKAVVGYSGNGRANMVWRPDTGFFAYTCGSLVVVEDLHSGSQQHWLGHPEEVSTLALSHDAQALASTSGCSSKSARCQIRVWDVCTGACRRLIFYHDSAVQALAFSPDDRLLATVGDYSDRTLALWSTATYELVTSTRLLEPVHSVAFGPGEATKLACVGQGAITFWFLQQHGADIHLQVRREPLPVGVGAGELTSLCFGAPPLLFCGSNAGQVYVWDTRSRRCFLAWEADDGEIGVLLCSGARLVSGSNTRRLRLWAVGAVPELRLKGLGARSGAVLLERELMLDGAIVSAAFDDQLSMGIAGTTAGTLWYVSWAQGTSTRLVSGHRNKVNEVAFSPDEARCATCAEDGSVRVWSVASMELVIQFQVLSQSCLCLAWSPPSRRHLGPQRLVAGYSDGTLRIFSVSRTEMEIKMRPHPSALTAVAFTADGQIVLSGDKNGLVAVSRPQTGMTVRVVRDHQGAPISAIQCRSKEHGDFGVPGTELWLAASGDQRVSVWAADWLEDRCELVGWLSFPAPALTDPPGHLPPSLAAFCPWDSDLLVCAGLGPRKELLLYSLHQKQVVETVPLPLFALSLSLSVGARLVAVGFTERLLRLVDFASGSAQDFAGHDDSVHLCRFSPSTRLLLTVAHNEVLLWEVSAAQGAGTTVPGAQEVSPVPVGTAGPPAGHRACSRQ